MLLLGRSTMVSWRPKRSVASYEHCKKRAILMLGIRRHSTAAINAVDLTSFYLASFLWPERSIYQSLFSRQIWQKSLRRKSIIILNLILYMNTYARTLFGTYFRFKFSLNALAKVTDIFLGNSFVARV